MNVNPNASPGSDLERRLAARLQPVRVPGAEQAWAQLAPHLGRPGSRPFWVTLATAATALVLIAVSAALANALIFPRGIVVEENAGGYGSAPATVAPTSQPTAPAAVSIAGQAGRIISIAPPPPFTVFQPSNLPDGMLMLAQAYQAEPQPSGQQLPTSAAAGATAAGTASDPATAQAAGRWSRELLGNSQEATLVLVYAAAPDDLVGLVQRSAIDKLLPAGETITVRGLPGTFTQQDGRTTLTWIEGDTYLELSVSTQTDELLAIGAVAAGLVVTPLTTPPPIPANASPDQPVANGQGAVAVAVGGSSAGNQGTISATAGDPTAGGQGVVATASFDRAALAQQCGAWDPNLFTTNPKASFEQVSCYALAITNSSGREDYSYDRVTWSEAAARLGIDQTIGPANDRIVWLVTIGTGNAIVNQVVLDTETGEPVVIVGHMSNP
jgi:hypothetical protein